MPIAASSRNHPEWLKFRSISTSVHLLYIHTYVHTSYLVANTISGKHYLLFKPIYAKSPRTICLRRACKQARSSISAHPRADTLDMDPVTAAGIGVSITSLALQLFAGCVKGIAAGFLPLTLYKMKLIAWRLPAFCRRRWHAGSLPAPSRALAHRANPLTELG